MRNNQQLKALDYLSSGICPVFRFIGQGRVNWKPVNAHQELKSETKYLFFPWMKMFFSSVLCILRLRQLKTEWKQYKPAENLSEKLEN